MKTSWDRWLLTQNITAERWGGPNPNFKEKEGGERSVFNGRILISS